MRDRGKGPDGDPRERAPSDLSTKTSNREGEARLSVVDGGAALDPRGETLHVSGLPSAREAVDVRGATLRSGREPPARVDVLGDTVDSGRHRAPEPAPTDALARTVDSGRGPRPGGIDRDLVFAAVEQRLLGRAAESVKLDRFVLLDRLGSGGMGVVYAAYDPKLDRKVALKLLHTGALSGTAQRRHSQSQLEREARAAAQLSHPNVVTVYDVGVVGDQVYLALEYVEGETLTAWLEGQERGWREIVAIFLGAADGLIAAHDAGVVHRDFKPDNVLLGGDGRPRVADFGLARTASGDGPSGVHAMISGAELGVSATAQDARADTMTAIGTIAGTPAYMSPEQFSGVEVGAASDQFSFCVALYEALFASRPFAGETIASLSASVLQGELSPPPRGHGVPTPIVRAIERGLATTPQDRFPSMRALRAALARELAPRRTAWAVGGLLTALLTGGGAAMALQPAAAPAPEDPCAGAEQALDDVWTGARGDALERRVAELNAPTALRLVGALRGELDAYAGAWTAMRRDACEDTHVRGEQSERLLDLRVACLDRHKLRLATLTEA
ncbi:MAG: serine/threonine-protein kinase, partial [Nannocystaceae bacterium]